MEKRAWELAHHLALWGSERTPAELLGEERKRLSPDDFGSIEAFRAAVKASQPSLIGEPEEPQDEGSIDG